MPASDWGMLHPERVSQWINFDGSEGWQYDASTPASMASRQTEGVAYLWNLLSKHHVALLADEVGMGKTFQALGVAALLWKMRPDARVLVMAPNRDICAHWEREYSAFLRFHYRDQDHCVKNSVGEGTVQTIRTCSGLTDLADTVKAGNAHLYLTTIHSLSGLVEKNEKHGNVATKAKTRAANLKNRIKRSLGERGFDLVIIDEAHYFRNRHGDSQRVNAALGFFGGESNRLAERALLLTATPSHTDLSDVRNILSYFISDGALEGNSVESLMKSYGLRRFRLMQGKDRHYSKREYRSEKATACGFSERPNAELFFAFYQRQLVMSMDRKKEKRGFLYGYLEGFESAGPGDEKAATKVGESEHAEEDSRRDYHKAPDTKVLEILASQYEAIFDAPPDHPKYGEIVESCVPGHLFGVERELHENKHLVFVRRIPSVRELTRRINHAYDRILGAKICEAWGIGVDSHLARQWRETSWSRDGFENMIRALKLEATEEIDLERDDEVTAVEGGADPEDSYLGSKIAELFVSIKGVGGQGDCAKVSQRFRKPTSIYAMFLEPSSDYLKGSYTQYYAYEQSGKRRTDYVAAAKIKRLGAHGKFAQQKEVFRRHDAVEEDYDREVKTVWMLVFELLSDGQKEKLRQWACHHQDVAENFANYLKTGFLFASPVMVELYAWFTEFEREKSARREGRGPQRDVQADYAAFFGYVSRRIEGSMLLRYFKCALDSFEHLCEKIIDHKSGEWEKDWRVLTSLSSPAWYASGESGNRQRLILGFNSPFYPNVLVATSVFQEGVNLHLQCRKVHHYGIAWTPGDNEQRVGRIDRLFGKVNELLRNGMEDRELEINYPYLQNSFDEDQVASFIVRKYFVEEKMDFCTQSTFDRTVELVRDNWMSFLRKPVDAVNVKDPYPAIFSKKAI